MADYHLYISITNTIRKLNAPHIIGYCYSAGGPTSHGAHAPIVATTNLSGITNEQCDFLYPKHEEKFDSVLQLNSQLAELVYFHLSQGHFPITLGGDHSCAIGTWSGVSRHAGGPIGLIFIDAHLDAHTPKTSPSRNLHGMSIAHLLGHGHTELTQISHDKPKISHQHLVYIGTRDYEQEEFDFIQSLGVKIFTNEDVAKHGVEKILHSAYEIASSCPHGYGISIDMDAFDPNDTPGVTNPAPNGISLEQFLHCWQSKPFSKAPQALEVCEYMPH